MDPLCVRHCGFKVSPVFRQLLPFNSNFLSSFLGMCLGVRNNQCNNVTVVENSVFYQNRVGLSFSCGSRCHVEETYSVRTFYVSSSYNLVYSRHVFCFFFIDFLEFSVESNLRLHQTCVQCVFRHFQLDIIAVVCQSADLGQCCRSDKCFAVVFAVLRHLDHDILERTVASENFCSVHYCIDNLLVACASADVPVFLEPVSGFLSCRVRVFLKELVCGYDKSRGAETALNSPCVHESNLDRVEVVGSAYTFDCGNLAVFLHFTDFLCT